MSPRGSAMANAKLSAMDVESLLRLREQVDAVLRDRRAELHEKLALLNGDKMGGCAVAATAQEALH